MTTCYTGCAPTTLITHPPAGVHHLAFTGANVEPWTALAVGLVAVGIGLVVWARHLARPWKT
jgi:hypothetical protein